jgi:hypothetical protein
MGNLTHLKRVTELEVKRVLEHHFGAYKQGNHDRETSFEGLEARLKISPHLILPPIIMYFNSSFLSPLVIMLN